MAGRRGSRSKPWPTGYAVVVLCATVALLGFGFCIRDNSEVLSHAASKALAIADRPRHRQNVCFIHVGKSGGSTISKSLKKLQHFNVIQDYMQIHGAPDQDRPQFDKRRDQKPAGGHRSSRKHQSNIKEQQYFAFGSGHMAACFDLGLTVLWVRDPVSRIVSTWNFHNASTLPATQRAVQALGLSTHPNVSIDGKGMDIDLDAYLRAVQATGQPASAQLLFEHIPHATLDISFYLQNCSEATRSGTKHWFIGRNEFLDSDWLSLLRDKLGLTMTDFHEAGHNHHAIQAAGKQLSPAAVRFVRDFYTRDYQCISELTQKKLLPPRYLEDIIAREVYRY